MSVDDVAAGLWLALFLGMCFIMWRMDRRIQVLEVRLFDVEEDLDCAHRTAHVALAALQAHLAGMDVEFTTVPLRQDDRE